MVGEEFQKGGDGGMVRGELYRVRGIWCETMVLLPRIEEGLWKMTAERRNS